METVETYLEPPFDIENRWSVTRTLGQSNFGFTYLATDKKDKKEKVIKIVKPNPYNYMINVDEDVFAIISFNSHINIITIYDFFIETFNSCRHFFSIMEYSEFGSLENHFIKTRNKNEKIDNKIQIDWSKQLIEAVKFLKSIDTIHRDIKPAHILLFNGQKDKMILKLGNFNRSIKLIGSMKVFDIYGTARYAAPEIDNARENNPYDYKVDIWSLGCVIYEICTLQFLFDYGENDPQTIPRLRNIVRNQEIKRLEENHKLGPILDKMLVRDPANRANAEDL